MASAARTQQGDSPQSPQLPWWPLGKKSAFWWLLQPPQFATQHRRTHPTIHFAAFSKLGFSVVSFPKKKADLDVGCAAECDTNFLIRLWVFCGLPAPTTRAQSHNEGTSRRRLRRTHFHMPCRPSARFAPARWEPEPQSNLPSNQSCDRAPTTTIRREADRLSSCGTLRGNSDAHAEGRDQFFDYRHAFESIS